MKPKRNKKIPWIENKLHSNPMKLIVTNDLANKLTNKYKNERRNEIKQEMDLLKKEIGKQTNKIEDQTETNRHQEIISTCLNKTHMHSNKPFEEENEF